MIWFKNRNTATKLMLSFACMALLAGVVGYQGIRSMGTLDELLKSMYEKHALGSANIQEAHLQILKASRGVSNAVIDGVFNDQKALEGRMANRKKYTAAFEKELGEFKTRIVRPEVRALTLETEKLVKELGDKEERLMEQVKANKLKEAHAALGELRKLANEVEEKTEKLVSMKIENMKKAEEEADATYRSARLFVFGVVAAAIALAMVIGVVISRMIARPLAQAV